MLGLGVPGTVFELAAHGKHPAFDDYFSLNTDSPLAKALSAWIEQGAKLNGNSDGNRLIRSFRFWVRGIKKGELVLGILRDSSDRMGRFYPLLLLAKGIVKDWEDHWNDIFNRFDSLFRTLEEITASRYGNFKEFEIKLRQARFPENSDPPGPGEKMGQEPGLPEKMKAWFEKDGKNGVICLSIAGLLKRVDSLSDRPEQAWYRLFKKKPRVPGAVFQGGLPENPILTIYARPLKPEDFFELFNAPLDNPLPGDPLCDKGDAADGD